MSESQNRAFLYGESVFTTMRMINGQLLNWHEHFERFKQGIEFVYGPFTDDTDWPRFLKDQLESRWSLETGDKVIRLTAFQEKSQGLSRHSLISVMDLRMHFSIKPFDPQLFSGKSIKLRTCAAVMKPHWWPGFLKVGNYLDTIMSQKMHLKEGDDDLLFLSPADTVLESSIANIFLIRHNKLYTAPSGPNVLAGIMRQKVLDMAGEFFDDVIESEATLDQLLKADAAFGSNSVRGLFLIDRIDSHEFKYDQDFLMKFGKMQDRVLK